MSNMKCDNATNHLVKFGDAYFNKSANLSKTDKIIARLFAVALSFVLHTIATYHATCAGILKLSGASTQEIEKRKQACNAAFRECMNLFLFGNFSVTESNEKKVPIISKPPVKAEPTPSLAKTETMKEPVLNPASGVKTPASLGDLNVDHDSDGDSTPPHTPLRSRSVPPELMTPRAQKGSVILTDPRPSEKPADVPVVTTGLSPFSKPTFTRLSKSPALSDDSRTSESSIGTLPTECSDLDSESGKSAKAKVKDAKPSSKDGNPTKPEESRSDCGSDGWEKVDARDARG